jgi:hypothetical protein
MNKKEKTSLLSSIAWSHVDIWDYLDEHKEFPPHSVENWESAGMDGQFFFVDSAAIDYLFTVLSHEEIGKTMVLCGMTRNDSYNCLYSKKTGKVHSRETLIEEMKMGEVEFNKMMETLIRVGVVCFLKGSLVDGSEMEAYFINPTLSQWHPVFDARVVELFENLREKSPSKFPKFVASCGPLI